MTHPESHQQRNEVAPVASGSPGLLVFLLGVVLATVAAVVAMKRDPLSTVEWIGLLAVMILAIGLELVSFARID